MKAKEFIIKLFKQPDDPKKPRPIFLIGLGIVVIVFAINLLLSNKGEDTAPAPVDSGTETSFLTKITDIFKFDKKEDATATPTADPSLPNIPVIPSDAMVVDQKLIDESKVVENDDFNMKKVKVEYEGRRDPMKSISGENVGTFDAKRIDDKPSDLIDESKDYFGGVAVDDIIFDSMTTGEDDKIRGKFIIFGSIYTDLEVGDYLAETYYIKDYNEKNNYVVLQYGNKTFKLNAQNILSGYQGTKTPIYK